MKDKRILYYFALVLSLFGYNYTHSRCVFSQIMKSFNVYELGEVEIFLIDILC